MHKHLPPPDSIGFSRHDHDHCIAAALAAAEARCGERALRFTRVRRRALEILLEDHRAMGAYEVLDRLQEEGLGAQPPAAYRALEFLVQNGFAHRVERLNAFVACTNPGEAHMPAFLICRKCSQIAETLVVPDLPGIAAASDQSDFALERVVIEAEGLCAACRNASST